MGKLGRGLMSFGLGSAFGVADTFLKESDAQRDLYNKTSGKQGNKSLGAKEFYDDSRLGKLLASGDGNQAATSPAPVQQDTAGSPAVPEDTAATSTAIPMNDGPQVIATESPDSDHERYRSGFRGADMAYDYNVAD